MKKILAIASLLIVVMGCNKDKFQTKPQLSLKSMTEVVPTNGTFTAVLEFTDKEGDVRDTLFFAENRLNIAMPAFRPWVKLPMPASMPSATKGEIEFFLNENDLKNFTVIQSGGVIQPDTVIFKFVLKDKANNTSDTLVTPQVVIYR